MRTNFSPRPISIALCGVVAVSTIPTVPIRFRFLRAGRCSRVSLRPASVFRTIRLRTPAKTICSKWRGPARWVRCSGRQGIGTIMSASRTCLLARAGLRVATRRSIGSSTILRRTTVLVRWRRAKRFSGISARMDSRSYSLCRSSIPMTSGRTSWLLPTIPGRRRIPSRPSLRESML